MYVPTYIDKLDVQSTKNIDSMLSNCGQFKIAT